MQFILKRGLIKLEGKDSLDLINRLSTNKTFPLEINKYVNTILLNEKGRIIDLVTVLNFGEYQWLLTSDIYTEKVIGYLNKYIIMDDVKVDFINNDVLTIWDTENIDLEMNDNEFIQTGQEIKFNDSLFINKCVTVDLNKSGEKLTEDMFDLFRIKNMIPYSPNEINENINPLECGLKNLISFSKGCYIGQEVIARLDAQEKIPKQMKQFSTVKAIDSGDKIYFSKINESEKKECGVVTTVSGTEGLSFIRSAALNSENEYFAENKNEFIKLNITY